MFFSIKYGGEKIETYMRKYNMEPTKKDWKLFREKIGGWQETYMERLINAVEYLVSR